MRPRPYTGSQSSRSGAALLLSLLILLVLVAIVIQINVGTSTDARVARNDIGLTAMDLAVESALLQVDDQLLQDGQNSDAGGAPGGAPGGTPGGAPPAASSPAAATAGGAGAPSDSRKDEWARPQRTTLNEIRLRILVVDEDSKINVLNMLNPDEKEAQAAFDRVVKVLDLCREGTQADIDTHTADQMARAMLEHMKRRRDSKIPRPALLSDDSKNPDQGLPLSLKEFAALPPFDESHFRDFRDIDGKIVHSIGSFLTVWTSVATSTDAARMQGSAPGGAPGSGAGSTGTGSGNGTPTGSSNDSGSSGDSPGTQPGGGTGTGTPAGGAGGAGAGGAGGAPGAAGGPSAGGYAVNVNTAPVAVLKSLFDDHDLHPRFFDRVIEYRNLEEEKPKDAPTDDTAAEKPLDEYGEEIIDRKFFDTLAKLSEVDGYQDLTGEIQTRLNQLLTTQSNVFSIFIIARRSTNAEGDTSDVPGNREEVRAREEAGDTLLRVVRSVVWRHKDGDDYVVTPIVRWEVLDYVPYEVVDYPDERR